jgi:hypothetical protein
VNRPATAFQLGTNFSRPQGAVGWPFLPSWTDQYNLEVVAPRTCITSQTRRLQFPDGPTTGVQLRGPEGAQRLRALSAATAEFGGVRQRQLPRPRSSALSGSPRTRAPRMMLLEVSAGSAECSSVLDIQKACAGHHASSSNVRLDGWLSWLIVPASRIPVWNTLE